ncbi:MULTISPECIES: hypothetical protein [unclassified Methanoregula]|uniref:hypothetical protein n=1 Tax=unclassified Methanoregula TaxID=2649730 RepID=UPI0009D305D7|nr:MULTISPECIES: hypothetical protein [unclassified Methanoregula]OPX63624.1 MAG: hypothetical protein A4E33_01559 [Methanoregula sp. PtaB.Bin085]OPY36210.1 MAG: hypothetical protein A4E34_00388 [Methanoregula sp. PtaU1.Bin006]
MKQDHRPEIILALILLTVIIAGVSAFTLAETSVSPLGYQPAGTPVTVTAVIDFPRKDLTSDTFPASHDLVISTGLSGARWEPVLVLDGRQTRLPQENGGTLTIGGMYLSYPGTQELKVHLTLTGTMPADVSPTKDFLRVQETDAQKNILATSSIAMPEVPLVVPTESLLPTTVPTTRKLPTPLPTTSPTPQSPDGFFPVIVAAAGAALMAMRQN